MEIQDSIVYHLRNSSKCVPYKGMKALMADLKVVYVTVDQTILDDLNAFGTR